MQEHAVVGTALVQLSRRVQEPRPIAQRGGDPFVVSHGVTQGLQLAVVLRIHFDIGVDGKVIARLQSSQVGGEVSLERARARGRGDRFGVGRIRKQADLVFLQQRRLRRQLARFFECACQLARGELAGLDIGLVERVDSEHGAGDSRGDLPAEKFLAELYPVLEQNTHDRVAGALQRRDGIVLFSIRCAVQAHINEQAVITVDLRRADALTVDRHNPFALLTGRFGDELLEPAPEGRDCR